MKVLKLAFLLGALVLSACAGKGEKPPPAVQKPTAVSAPSQPDTLPTLPLRAAPTDYPLIAAYFDSRPHSGLRLAVSDDGYVWREVTRDFNIRFSPTVGPWAMFRDPSIARGPDGMFHLVWTTGHNGFGYARSKDLISWSAPRYIRVDRGVLGGRPLRLTWAPDLYYDKDLKKFIITFASADRTVPGLKTGYKGNFFAYYITTADFETFSPPEILLNPHADYFEIDPALIKVDGTYYAFVKVESDNTVNGRKDGIHYATAKSLTGPWSKLSWPRLPGNIPNSEAPSAVRLADEYVVYYDKHPGLAGASSKNLKKWKNITPLLNGPPNFGHGSVIRIGPVKPLDKDLLDRIM